MVSITVKNVIILLETSIQTFASELICSLPKSWRFQFGSHRWMLIEHDKIQESDAISGQRPLALILPRDEILVRQIDLPLTSRFQLSGLMRFEAGRHVPLPIALARVDFRIVERDIARLRMLVELAIVRVSTIEALFAVAAEHSIDPEAIAIRSNHGIWFAKRLLVWDWRSRWFNQRRRLNAIRLAIPVFLAIISILGLQNWATRLVSDRNAVLQKARLEAASVEPLRVQLTALDVTLAQLATARDKPTAANITEEIARLLPDTAWLDELDISGGTIHIRGTANDATQLLKVFASSNLFTSVNFEAPIIQAQGHDGDQFDISMSLRSIND